MTEEVAERRRRPTAGVLALVAPILLAGGVLLGGLAWMVTIQSSSGQATGEWVKLRLKSACGDEPKGAILARLADYGLDGHFEQDGSLLFQLPGQEDDREHMPIALTRPGHFEVWINGAKHLDHFDEAGVQIALEGTATAIVMVGEHLEPDGLQVRIDGLPIDAEVNDRELQLRVTEDTSLKALRQATDWVVTIRHPLPCEVTTLGIESATN